MVKNHTYNLLKQLVQESKSLWRMKNNYEAESDCEECRVFWKKLIEKKENTVNELQEILKKHM